MSFRIPLVGILLVAGLSAAAPASAGPTTQSVATSALQVSAPSDQARYELGAVVDVRRASIRGVTLLAVTPGGAADRMGLQPGDQLRVINGRRLDNTPKPSSTFESALQEGNGALQVEAMRNGETLLLSGRMDIVNPSAQGRIPSCGYVSAQAGVVPRTQQIFRADITQIDGRSTPLQPVYRHRVSAGKHVLVVREFIDQTRLNSAQLQQIGKMKRFALARAYKSLVVDVEPGMSYRIGARLLKDKLDTQSIRDNAYWEPVVWQQVAETCP
ncbi:MAG TPA: PDZ domain-containing protein [Pseudoxanthomonas sp.]|nr:PDZ domain-containing protein [Pseudoxanthomonas sp.]